VEEEKWDQKKDELEKKIKRSKPTHNGYYK